MKCPKCNNHKLKTIGIANNTPHNETLRKKKCLKCKNIFYTVEFEAVNNEQFKKEWLTYGTTVFE